MHRTRHETRRGGTLPQCRVWLRCGLAVASLMLASIAAPAPVRAQFTQRDGQIIARTLSFVEPRPTGTIQVAIAYAPSHPASLHDAESLLGAIGDGLHAGSVTLTARLVPVDQLADAAGIAAIVVAGDLGADLDKVAQAAQRLQVPSISTELACVRSARCILAFSSEPTVEIVLNHAAASSAGVHFAPAFRLLVREL